MTLKKRRVGLVPIGDVSEITPKAIAAHILGYLNLDVDILPPLEHPTYAHNERRFQYDAGVILKATESILFDDYAKIINLLDHHSPLHISVMIPLPQEDSLMFLI